MKLMAMITIALLVAAFGVPAQMPGGEIQIGAPKLASVVIVGAPTNIGVIELAAGTTAGVANPGPKFVTTAAIAQWYAAQQGNGSGVAQEGGTVVAPIGQMTGSWKSGGVDISVTAFQLRTESNDAFVDRFVKLVEKAKAALPPDDQGEEGGTAMLLLAPILDAPWWAEQRLAA